MDFTGSQSAANEDDLKWLAAFMDGEGSYLLAGRQNGSNRIYHPMVTINNTHKPTIERISAILKARQVGHWICRTNHANRKHKPNWTVEVSGMKRVQKFLPLLIPYCFTKKAQAETLKAFIDLRMGGSIRTTYGQAEEELITRLKEMNRFGCSETIRVPEVTTYTLEDIVQA